MPASQIQVRASATEDRLPRVASHQDRSAVHGQTGARLAWRRRRCPSSFVLAGITVLVLWVAVARLLRQGRLESVLSAGRAELAAPLLVALVVATGICERIWPAERRPVLARGHVQDLCFVALHAIVVIPLMTLLSVGAAALIGSHARWIELRSTEHWPGWLLFLAHCSVMTERERNLPRGKIKTTGTCNLPSKARKKEKYAFLRLRSERSTS